MSYGEGQAEPCPTIGEMIAEIEAEGWTCTIETDDRLASDRGYVTLNYRATVEDRRGGHAATSDRSPGRALFRAIEAMRVLQRDGAA